MNKWINGLTTGLVSKWIIDRMNELVNEWINGWLPCSTIGHEPGHLLGFVHSEVVVLINLNTDRSSSDQSKHRSIKFW